MRRVINGLSYVFFILWAIIVGTAKVVGHLFRVNRPYAHPMIVEVPLRCRTDLEVTLFASSITITPGTLVTAIAAGTATTPPVFTTETTAGTSRLSSCVRSGRNDGRDFLDIGCSLPCGGPRCGDGIRVGWREYNSQC